MAQKKNAIGRRGFLKSAGAGGVHSGADQDALCGFKRQLRNPINDMPPYPENLLSEQQMADIYAFLQGLAGRRPVKDIPTLNNNY